MNRDDLTGLQWSKLRCGLEQVLATNRFWRQKFEAASISADSIRSMSDLQRIPFTSKEELLDDQQEHPPYGSNRTFPDSQYVRLHQTSGTSGRRLRWLDTQESWSWVVNCWSQILSLAGVTPDDRGFFPFSFGPFLGFWAAFEASQALGCLTIAGGGMTTHARLEAILAHDVTLICCTPTHAQHLVEVASREGLPLRESAVRLLILAGEPGGSIGATRQRLEEGFGARVIDHSGMTEVGPVATETMDLPGKMFVLENQFIAEFVEVGSDKPVGEGELGELVLTNLGRWASPLLRYRTGDVCRWRADAQIPGLPFVYLDGGILGRADDMLWIKGNNVYPSTIEAVLRDDPNVAEFQIELDDAFEPPNVCIVVEPFHSTPTAELEAALSRSFQNRLFFRPSIRLVEPGSLPRFEMKAKRIVRLSKES